MNKANAKVLYCYPDIFIGKNNKDVSGYRVGAIFRIGEYPCVKEFWSFVSYKAEETARVVRSSKKKKFYIFKDNEE